MFDGETESVRVMKERLRAESGKGPSRSKAACEPVTSVAKVESDRSRKNSRTKGSRAELDVAAMFSGWCGELVRRTPQSGGWSNAKFGVTADLVCANKAFPFSVEIKHREGWVLDDLVTGVRQEHDKSIVQWWKQCVESCPKTTSPKTTSKRGSVSYLKEPLLVFRRNHQPWLVMSRAWPNNMLTDVETVGAVFTLPLGVPIRDVVVTRLDTFLKLTPVPEGLAGWSGLSEPQE